MRHNARQSDTNVCLFKFKIDVTNNFSGKKIISETFLYIVFYLLTTENAIS